jgi:hypothetical protein
MALEIKVHPSYKDQRVTTETGVATLADHTPYELLTLAIMAKKSGNKVLTRCFVNLPSLADLMNEKVALETAMMPTAMPQEVINPDPVVDVPNPTVKETKKNTK